MNWHYLNRPTYRTLHLNKDCCEQNQIKQNIKKKEKGKKKQKKELTKKQLQ